MTNLRIRVLGIAYVVAMMLALAGIANGFSQGNGGPGTTYTAGTNGNITISGSTLDFTTSASGAGTVVCNIGGFYSAMTPKVCVSNNGDIGSAATINAASSIRSNQFGTNGYVPPMFTLAYGATGTNSRIEIGTCTFSAATTCAISFTGTGNAWTSTTSYECHASMGTATTYVGFTVGNQSTTGATVYASASNSDTVVVSCIGS